MAAADELNQMIAQLRKLPELVESVLPEVAVECKTVIAENIAAQRGPDGTPWQPGARGQPVLQNAAAAITAQAIGNVVLITVSGVEAKHHLGRVRGRIKRPIIPSGRLPQPMAEAIARVVKRKLDTGVK